MTNCLIKLTQALLLLAFIANQSVMGHGIKGPAAALALQRGLQDEEPEDTPSAEEPSEEGDANEEGDSDSDSDEDGVKAPSKRKCDTEFDGKEVEFECKTKEDDGEKEIKDKIKFKVEAKKSEVLKVKVGYKSKIETDTAETETETEYTVIFDRMVEYRKVAGATVENYEWEEDEVVTVWPLNDWKVLSPVATDGNLLTFSATTEDEIVEFTFTIAQADVGAITSNKMKIDFLLTDYPWAVSDSYIALICHVETEQEIEIETEDGDDEAMDVVISFDDAVNTIGYSPFGEYTWADTAEVQSVVDENVTAVDVAISRNADGTPVQLQNTTISVVASTSPVTMDEGSEIAFSFIGAGQGASSIYWDPEAGVGYGSSAFKACGTTALALGLFLGATVLALF